MTIYEVLLLDKGSVSELVEAEGFYVSESGVLVFFDENNDAFQAFNIPNGYIVRVYRKAGDKNG